MAYVVPRDSETPTQDQLVQYLKQRLPTYMLPTAWVTMDSLPLSSVGKIDQRALPAAPTVRCDRQEDWTAPRTPVEEMLASIWAKVLGVGQVGIDDNFFNLGGHSLLAVKLCARIEKVFGVRLPLTVLFEAPTIRGLADLVQHQHQTPGLSSLVPIRASGSRPPFYCIHGGDGYILKFHALVEHLGTDQPVFVLQPRAIEGREMPLKTVEEIAAAYLAEVQAFQPEGPYYLGGYSFGGLIAFEMARQMRLQQQQVPLLALFDTLYPPSESDTAIILGGSCQKWSRTIRRTIAEQIYSAYLRLGCTVPGLVRHFYIRDTHRQAAVAYQPQMYPGQVTYFAAEDIQAETRIRLWRQHAADGIDVRQISGLHSDIFTSDGTGEFVQQLRNCLESAQAEEVNANVDVVFHPSFSVTQDDTPDESSMNQQNERKAA